ncbi:ankyrin repeat-containing domain protein [Neocallimastix sp. 'constans']
MNNDEWFNAAKNGNLVQIKKMIQSGNINIDQRNYRGNTALKLAAQHGHTELTKFLIESGANIDIKDFYGDTALISTTYFRHIEVLKLLIKANANVNARNHRGVTALSFAVVYNNFEMANILIDAGARVDSRKKIIEHMYSSEIENLLKRAGAVFIKNPMFKCFKCSTPEEFSRKMEIYKRGVTANDMHRYWL